MSIRLHKEFGLNATISQCILCGQEKNEIALLGASYKGQAPMRMVTNIEPCEKCREKYLSKGVMLVEATKDRFGRPVPTGKIVVIKNEVFEKIINIPIPKSKIAFMEEEAFEKFRFPTGVGETSKKKLKEIL